MNKSFPVSSCALYEQPNKLHSITRLWDVLLAWLLLNLSTIKRQNENLLAAWYWYKHSIGYPWAWSYQDLRIWEKEDSSEKNMMLTSWWNKMKWIEMKWHEILVDRLIQCYCNDSVISFSLFCLCLRSALFLFSILCCFYTTLHCFASSHRFNDFILS